MYGAILLFILEGIHPFHILLLCSIILREHYYSFRKVYILFLLFCILLYCLRFTSHSDFTVSAVLSVYYIGSVISCTLFNALTASCAITPQRFLWKVYKHSHSTVTLLNSRLLLYPLIVLFVLFRL